ncbi:hypothetical protein V5799_030144 [Amblyomma americanum]|uniref:Uncharacterized protein n=1 Tax=Amblyomma americanum TaxID=6943 RepID=A0AAQ4EP08_AMBAM
MLASILGATATQTPPCPFPNALSASRRAPQLGSPVGSGLLWASWANFVSVLGACGDCCHVREPLLSAGLA